MGEGWREGTRAKPGKRLVYNIATLSSADICCGAENNREKHRVDNAVGAR